MHTRSLLSLLPLCICNICNSILIRNELHYCWSEEISWIGSNVACQGGIPSRDPDWSGRTKCQHASDLENLWESRKFSPKVIWVFPKIGVYTPKSLILIGFSIINHPFWGTSIFGNIHMEACILVFWYLGFYSLQNATALGLHPTDLHKRNASMSRVTSYQRKL